MAVKAGNYLGPQLQGYRGVTQGYHLSSTVLNVVLDAVIRHWVTVVAPTESGAEGLGDTIQELAKFSYVDERLVLPPWPERLQRALNVIAEIFDQVGLHKNSGKMVIIACQPCFIPGVLTNLEYTRRLTGISPSYQERLQRRVECPE